MAFTGKHIIVWFTFFLCYHFLAAGLSGQEIELYPDAKTDRINSFDLFGFPEFIVKSSEQTTHGYYVFEISPYLGIIDHYGNPMFYYEIHGGVRNFEPQPNGQFSYYSIPDMCFYVMNNHYQVMDTFEMKNGYSIDFHEFNILENGNIILMGYDIRQIDLSQLVEGGNPMATVTGLVYQELDQDLNLLFEWNSWDYIPVTDSDTSMVDLTAQVIGYMHGNSISIDQDGHFLLSSRHLSEITKINRTTGEIIWRLGGKQNEFDFVNDPLGFSAQHSAIRLPNGNIALFDNGNGHEPQFSRGLEYELNEIEKTAHLIREYREIPDTYAALMGNVAPLPGNHFLVGWGRNSADGFLTEYDQEGTACTTISMQETAIYSSYRISFQEQIQSFISIDKDTLDFGHVEMGDSAILTIKIRNEANYSATLDGFSEESDQFTLLYPLPIQIAEGGTKTISLKFKPTGTPINFIPAYLNCRVDSMFEGEHLIACRIILNGSSPVTSSDAPLLLKREVTVAPNPFSDRIVLENSDRIQSITFWSLTGEKACFYQNSFNERIELSDIPVPPGIYILELQFVDGSREFVKVVKSR